MLPSQATFAELPVGLHCTAAVLAVIVTVGGVCAACVNRCCCPSAVKVEMSVAAADEYMAGSINSSLVQSVQNSTALARCLGVSGVPVRATGTRIHMMHACFCAWNAC